MVAVELRHCDAWPELELGSGFGMGMGLGSGLGLESGLGLGLGVELRQGGAWQAEDLEAGRRDEEAEQLEPLE